MRSLRTFLTLGLALVLGLMLIATIYFTLFDLEWIAFLAGVLFAATAAIASQVSKAEWLIVRRTKQLQRAKDQLAVESTRHRNATEALKGAEGRFRLVFDALPQMIVYVDRNLRCHEHNHAFAQWAGRAPAQIDGHALREVAGDQVYENIKSHSEVLAGNQARYAAAWSLRGDGDKEYAVTLLPYLDKNDQTIGCYALIAPAMQPGAAAGAAPGIAPMATPGSSELLYLDSMATQLMGGHNPRTHLLRALQEDQFLLFAQKIEPLAANAPYPRCFEVLLRLQEEEDYLAPPGGFFPVAERYDLMADIDRWVVRNLLASCLRRSQSDPAWQTPLYCVNLATASLCDPEFAPYVREQLHRHNFPAGNLCFEIAHLDANNHHAQVKAFIDRLKPAGCRFTLDSFGSVKVSFGPLRQLPLDFLKIDGMIVANILSEPTELAKLRAIVTVSRKIGMRTIAAFVEDDETLAKLREAGVDYAQGFGIGKPGPLVELS